jgi:hypothetical protein
MDGLVMISQIEEVGADVGEPDCKLVKPFQASPDGTLNPLLWEYTDDQEFMISSDKIFTISEPREFLLDKYKELIE